MKEFCMKHPIITFLLGDLAIRGIYQLGAGIINLISASKGITVTEEKAEETTEEVTVDEPAGDSQ